MPIAKPSNWQLIKTNSEDWS